MTLPTSSLPMLWFCSPSTLPKKVRFSTRGDRHVAFGYALKAGRQLFVVGPQESLFHQLPNVLRFDETEEMVRYLAEFGSGRYRCDGSGT